MNVENIGLGLQAARKIISIQEGGAGLSHMRFVQDTATCLLPKAVFARSKADLAENAFLELSESTLVYYGASILGEGLFRKLYDSKLSTALKKQISTPATELLKAKQPANKQLMAVKAAIALSCMAIPLIEFSLNYFKNLLTLRVFNQGDFNDIAKLDKNKEINTAKNIKVAKNAKRKIIGAASVFGAFLATSAILLKKGQNSKLFQNISELILAPGNKLFKNQKLKDFANKYFSLDFANNNGKLALSKGQLTSCVLIGGLGYFDSAKDRGKQNFLEVLYRMPIVGFYIICGNELLEQGFKKMLLKMGKCKETIGKNLEVPKISELKGLAEKICAKNGGSVSEMYKKLLKQKTLIAGVPFLFGIGVMGFFVAATSRYFTQYRYNREKAQKAQKAQNNNIPQVFSSFLNFSGDKVQARN